MATFWDLYSYADSLYRGCPQFRGVFLKGFTVVSLIFYKLVAIVLCAISYCEWKV